MPETPFFSIIIPTYNRAHLISETLDSILNQTFENFKLIIADDCSTDGSAEICKEYTAKDKRIHYIRNKENKGISAFKI